MLIYLDVYFNEINALILYAEITINICAHSPYQRLTSKGKKLCALNSISVSIWGLFCTNIHWPQQKYHKGGKMKWGIRNADFFFF